MLIYVYSSHMKVVAESGSKITPKVKKSCKSFYCRNGCRIIYNVLISPSSIFFVMADGQKWFQRSKESQNVYYGNESRIPWRTKINILPCRNNFKKYIYSFAYWTSNDIEIHRDVLYILKVIWTQKVRYLSRAVRRHVGIFDCCSIVKYQSMSINKPIS